MRFLVIQVPKGLDRLMLSTNQSISNVNKIAASIQDIINIGSLNGTAMTMDIKEATRHAQQVHQKLSSLDKTNTALMKAVEAHLNSLGSTVKKAERWSSAGPVMPPIYVRQAQAHFEENTLHEFAPKSAVEVEEGESCTKEELDSIEDMSWWDHVKYGFSKSMDSFVEIGNSIWDGVEDRSEKAFDSFYDYGNHVTFGLFDAGVSMWDGAQMRYNEFIDDPNVFTFVNYASIGTYDMFVGTVNPDDPYSTDHWLSSAGLAGSLAGGAGLATRGAVSALKQGARNSGSVNSVKSGSRSPRPAKGASAGAVISGAASNAFRSIRNAADSWLNGLQLAGFTTGGAGAVTRSAMSGSRRSGGAVKDVKSGAGSNSSVNSVKSGSKSAGTANNVSGTKSSGSVNSAKSGSQSSGTANNVSGTKSSGSVNSAKSGSKGSGTVKDVKSGSASSGTVNDVKGTGKPTDKVVNGISAADRAKLDGWAYRPSDEMYLKYKETFDNPKYYDQKTGDIQWPPNDGFKGKRVETMLEPGMVIDRYGDPGGSFLSPAGTPYEMRALALHSDSAPYYQYRVKKPLPVESGEIAPWFDRPGGGTQYLTSIKVYDKRAGGYITPSVEDLVRLEYLDKIKGP
ncbi:glycohydrolase toxin TNT-related protein [Bacillus sp. FSL W7-1360]